jgi:hypothetical protein
MSNAAFISHESNCDQNQHHEEDNALFIFGQLENSEQAFHVIAAQLVISVFNLSYLSSNASVMLSEAKHLWSLSSRAG